MTLKAIVDSVPEGLEDHYVEKDGKFVLSVEPAGGYALEDISGLKGTIENLKREKDEVVEQSRAHAKTLAERDAQIEDLNRVVETMNSDESINSRVEVEVGKVRRNFKGQLDDLTERNKSLTNQVDDLVRRQAVHKAIRDAGGNEDLLLPHVLSHTKLQEADGQFHVGVVGDDGALARNDSGEPLTIADFVAKLKETPAYMPAFQASGASGTGSVPNRTSGVGIRRSAMSAEEKAEFFKTHDPSDYMKLPE